MAKAKVFYALIQGKGQGCDYTIGCNERFEKLDADTLAEAREVALEEWGGALCRTGQGAVDKIVILEGIEHPIDAEKVRADAAAERNSVAGKAKEATDRAEYERLKDKFDPVRATEVKVPRRSHSEPDADCG